MGSAQCRAAIPPAPAHVPASHRHARGDEAEHTGTYHCQMNPSESEKHSKRYCSIATAAHARTEQAAPIRTATGMGTAVSLMAHTTLTTYGPALVSGWGGAGLWKGTTRGDHTCETTHTHQQGFYIPYPNSRTASAAYVPAGRGARRPPAATWPPPPAPWRPAGCAAAGARGPARGWWREGEHKLSIKSFWHLDSLLRVGLPASAHGARWPPYGAVV